MVWRPRSNDPQHTQKRRAAMSNPHPRTDPLARMLKRQAAGKPSGGTTHKVWFRKEK